MTKDYSDKPRLYWLDWLRFTAALMVVCSHARAETWVPWGELAEGQRSVPAFLLFASTRFAHEAVVLFFVLSGFFVGGKVWDTLSMRNQGQLPSYAIDRAVRIYLPLIPVLALTFVVQWVISGHVVILDILGAAFSLQGIITGNPAANVSLWSLSYEVWFYILAGALIAVFEPRPLARWIGLGILILAFAVFAKLHAGYLVCWIIGALGWRLAREKRHVASIFAFGIVALVGLALSVHLDFSGFGKDSPERMAAYIAMSFGLAGLLGPLGRAQPTPCLRPLELAGSRLADFSYTLYLAHFPVFVLFRPVFPGVSESVDGSSLGRFGTYVISASAASWLMYLVFESRTAEVKTMLKRRLRLAA